MASTVADLISASITALGQLGRGQTMSPEDAAQGFREANLLLAQKSTQRLFLSYVAIREYTLTATVASYTLGPSGVFVAARPTLVESAQAQIQGTTSWFPISVWDKPKFDGITGKGDTGEKPNGVYVEYNFPNVVLYVNPIPTGAAKLRLGAWEALTQFTSLFDIIAMPPAYESYLEAALAIILAPFYDQPVTASLADRRTETMGDLERYNAQSLGGALSASQRLDSPNVGQPIPTAPAGTQGA